MTKLFSKFDRLKTYLAAAGLFGLAIYQTSIGQYEPALQSLMAALAAAGLRNAIAKSSANAQVATTSNES